MKLTARINAYSTVVGGGAQLLDEKGHAKFQIALIGTTQGITKQETAAISQRLVELINEHGLEIATS